MPHILLVRAATTAQGQGHRDVEKGSLLLKSSLFLLLIALIAQVSLTALHWALEVIYIILYVPHNNTLKWLLCFLNSSSQMKNPLAQRNKMSSPKTHRLRFGPQVVFYFPWPDQA